MREYVRELVVLKRTRVLDRDRDMTLAWTTAALTRTKELPKLQTLLSSKGGGAKRPQSGREQVLMWQTIAAYFGGTFTPMNTKA
jgi:hypothetical protein